MLTRIVDFTTGIYPRLIQIRRQCHQTPERAWEERQTSAYILEVLQTLGVPAKVLATTGICVDLVGREVSPAVGLRIEMDGLPIQEATAVPYASRHKGMMHACGHDVHIAIGLGVIEVLHHLVPELPGTVRVFFQPAKELHAGGARRMIQEGVLSGLNAVYGFHVDPALQVGQVGVRPGTMISSSDELEIEIRRQGAPTHYAEPSARHVAAAAQIITSLNQVTGRAVDPLKPARVVVYSISSPAANRLSRTVRLKGCYQAMHEEVRKQLPQLIQDTVEGISKAYGVESRLEFKPGTAILDNEVESALQFRKAAEEVPGVDEVVTRPYPLFGVEDFSSYLQSLPGSYVRLGSCGNAETGYPLHSNRFNVDERCIEIGVKALSWALFRFLQIPPHLLPKESS